MREYKLLIKGKWEVSKSRQEIKSPYDQNVVGKVYFAEKDQTEKAVSTLGVRSCFLPVSKISYKRIKISLSKSKKQDLTPNKWGLAPINFLTGFF